MSFIRAAGDPNGEVADPARETHNRLWSGTTDAGTMEDLLRPRLERVPGVSALSVTGPVASRPWSRVFRGRGSAYPTPVAIKLCLDPSTGQASPELARAYFRALTSVHEAMDGHSLFASARPYALFEDLGVVVAEWVDGPTLSRLVTGSPPMNARLAVRKAGAWLARLHRSTNHAFRPLNAEEMLAQLEEAMTGFRRPVSGGVFGRALDALHQMAPSVTGSPIVWTYVHGDFKPDNMLVSNGKLTGIDMDLRYPGPGVLDAAQFLNHLALLLRTPRGIRRLSYGNEIRASFRRGYEQDGGLPLDSPQLAWVSLHNAVRLLLKHRDWSSGPVGWMTGWSLRQLIARSTDVLERSNSAATDAPARPEMPAESAAAGRIAYLEDVLTFLAEDEDTWLSPDADRLLCEVLRPQAERKD